MMTFCSDSDGAIEDGLHQGVANTLAASERCDPQTHHVRALPIDHHPGRRLLQLGDQLPKSARDTAGAMPPVIKGEG